MQLTWVILYTIDVSYIVRDWRELYCMQYALYSTDCEDGVEKLYGLEHNMRHQQTWFTQRGYRAAAFPETLSKINFVWIEVILNSNGKASMLCPAQTLHDGSAQLGQVVGDTAS